MEDEIDDTLPLIISPDKNIGFGFMRYVGGRPEPMVVSKERKEEIVEWFFEFYPDVDYVLMGDEIIIKDRDCRMHFKMMWG